MEQYKEKLEEAKKLYESANDDQKHVIESLFPELKESEDEKMWKLIKKYAHYNISDIVLDTDHITREQLESWLEKQGESDETKAKIFLIKKGYPIDANGTFPTYKEMCNIIRERLKKIAETCITICDPDAYRIGFADGEAHAKEESQIYETKDGKTITYSETKGYNIVKPKFNIDDWIIHKGTKNVYKVVAIINNKYQLKYSDNYTIQKCADVDRYSRLWDINKDAKDGDVLATNKGSIFIYANVLYSKPYAYCGINSFGIFKHDCLGISWANSINIIHPATKEQRELLFQKMKEDGYEWDAEKKELKKIKQKPVWSKGDKNYIKDLTNFFTRATALEHTPEDIANWLKYLKQKIEK